MQKHERTWLFGFWFMGFISGLLFVIVLAADGAFGQEPTLEDLARIKADVQKDFRIGQLMMENAQMKFEKLMQQEEVIKQKESKTKETKK